MKVLYRFIKIVGKSFYLSKVISMIFFPVYYRIKKNEIDKIFEVYKCSRVFKEVTKSELLEDMAFCNIYYGMIPEEYFVYRLYNLSALGRKEYISEAVSTRYFYSIEGLDMHELFRNKYATYKKFEQYYKRKILFFDSCTSLDEFKKFCIQEKDVVVKPLDGYGGIGIYIRNFSNDSEIENEYQKLSQRGQYIIESLIKQAESMKVYHPKSVNTVRIVTCFANDCFEILSATIRMGAENSVTDNTTNGGIAAEVDIETGIVESKGRRFYKEGLFILHPDTRVQILGSKIPKWDELKKIVKELAYMVPEQRLVGWDFALSDDGWVVVEANTLPGIQGLLGEGHGARIIFERIKEMTK